MNWQSERIETVVLAWLWCQKSPADAAKVAKAIAPLLTGDADDATRAALDRLTAAGAVTRTEKKTPKGKPPKADYAIAKPGVRRAQAFSGRQAPPKTTPFPALLAGPFAAIALELPVPASDADLKAFKKALPLAVCVRPLGVSLADGADAAKCTILARALNRLFDPPAKLTFKKLPSGEATMIAMASELGIPPDRLAFKTVDSLIGAAALREADVTKAAEIPVALVRRWLSGGAPADMSAPSAVVNAPTTIPPASFARDVLAAARDVVATNGRGVSNLRDQVLVGAVRERYASLFGEIAMDEFKRHLRDVSGGEVMLVCEDRIPADRLQEFRESEVRIGASVFHYIRV